jgi:hypothetical protein
LSYSDTELNKLVDILEKESLWTTIIFINKSEGSFLIFFNFSGIGLTTEMRNNWTIIKITHYKRKIYS